MPAASILGQLLVVLVAPRCLWCVIGFFVLDSCDVHPGVSDGV